MEGEFDEEAVGSTPQESSIAEEKLAVATRAVTALDWNGPDDPENPMNVKIFLPIYCLYLFLYHIVTPNHFQIMPKPVFL